MEKSIESVRTNVLVAILLSIVTFGIYMPVWFLRRAPFFNQLSNEKKLNINTVKLVLYLECSNIALYIFLMILKAAQISSTASLIILILAILYRLIDLVAVILILLLAFDVRRILDDYYNKRHSKNISFSGIFTFLFTIYFLQYKINRLPEITEETIGTDT